MNPKTDIIVARHTGRFRISPVGRVGTYESAVRRHRCRARKYWIIEEELPEVVIEQHEENGMKWESRRKEATREDFGKFKTKTLAIQFMKDYAEAHPGVVLEGDLTGYPRMILSGPSQNGH